jgi:hypothetical protein
MTRRFMTPAKGTHRLLVLVLATTLAVGLDTGTALALRLPLESPQTPVEAPSVEVETPTVPVKAPTVTVKAPAVPVKTPTVSTKTPAPAKAPSTPSHTQAPVKTSGKGSSAAIEVSTSKGEGTSVSVAGEAPSVTVGRGSSGTPSTNQPQGHGAAPAAGGGADAGPSSAATGAVPTGAVPTDGSPPSAQPGGSYGELPAAEGPMSRRERARIARREHALKSAVARSRECLTALPQRQRELLELRAGTGQARALTPVAAAARLHVPAARFARLEHRAIGELGHAASTGGCMRASGIAAQAMAFIGRDFGRGVGGSGGVEGVRYEGPASSTDGPAPAAKHPSSETGALLGIGLPGRDLTLLLLVPLLAIALTIAEMRASGRRGRPSAWRPRRRRLR